MDGYKQRSAVVTDADEEGLHMFFSPYRVPEGLTNAEVRRCIELYPKKKAYEKKASATIEASVRKNLIELLKESRWRKAVRDFWGDVPAALAVMPQLYGILCVPNILPPELSPGKTMTRGRFRKGIAIFEKQLSAA